MTGRYVVWQCTRAYLASRWTLANDTTVEEGMYWSRSGNGPVKSLNAALIRHTDSFATPPQNWIAVPVKISLADMDAQKRTIKRTPPRKVFGKTA